MADRWAHVTEDVDYGSDDEFEREFERKASLAKNRIRVNSARGERPASGTGHTFTSPGSRPASARYQPSTSAPNEYHYPSYGNVGSTHTWGSAHTASATYVSSQSRPASARNGSGGEAQQQRFTSQFTTARPASHYSNLNRNPTSSSSPSRSSTASASTAPRDEEEEEEATAAARRRVKEEQQARGGGGKYATPMPSVTYKRKDHHNQNLDHQRSGQGQEERLKYRYSEADTCEAERSSVAGEEVSYDNQTSSSTFTSPPPSHKTKKNGDTEDAPPGSPFDRLNESFGKSKARAAKGMGLSGIDQDELDAAMEVVEHASMLNIDLAGLCLFFFS